MAIAEIELKKTGGEPKITVLIGQAQYGEYTVKLKDPATGSKVVQAEGDNADEVIDTFGLKTKLAALNGHLLSWWVTVAAPADSPGQAYFVRIEVRQKNKIVTNGSFEYSGPIVDSKNVIGAARLVVA
jgi:hypothetical protein